MTKLRLTLNNLPTSSKRILQLLEYSAEEVTMANVGRELGFTFPKVRYAVGCLRKNSLVYKRKALCGKMSETLLSVNAETVARSDIMEMIHNV